MFFVLICGAISALPPDAMEKVPLHFLHKKSLSLFVFSRNGYFSQSFVLNVFFALDFDIVILLKCLSRQRIRSRQIHVIFFVPLCTIYVLSNALFKNFVPRDFLSKTWIRWIDVTPANPRFYLCTMI